MKNGKICQVKEGKNRENYIYLMLKVKKVVLNRTYLLLNHYLCFMWNPLWHPVSVDVKSSQSAKRYPGKNY